MDNKKFSDAELSAEFLQGVLDFKNSVNLDEMYQYMERSPRTKKANQRMHTLSHFLYANDCTEVGF